MGEMTWLERLLNRISWWITGIRHLHGPNEMYNCGRCQYEGWLDIAKEYPKGSLESKHALENAELVKKIKGLN